MEFQETNDQTLSIHYFCDFNVESVDSIMTQIWNNYQHLKIWSTDYVKIWMRRKYPIWLIMKKLWEEYTPASHDRDTVQRFSSTKCGQTIPVHEYDTIRPKYLKFVAIELCTNDKQNHWSIHNHNKIQQKMNHMYNSGDLLYITEFYGGSLMII